MSTPQVRGVTLDSGALIALENRNHRVQALLERLREHEAPIAVPAGVIAQIWRGGPRQARIARLLGDRRVEEVPLDPLTARAVGLLAGHCGHPDVVDVSVALCARERGQTVLTTDPDDIHAVDSDLGIIAL